MNPYSRLSKGLHRSSRQQAWPLLWHEASLANKIVCGLIATLLFVFSQPNRLSASDTAPLRDTIVHEDITWSGTVVIDGVFVVGRTATLTITPGTTVLFKRRDANQDGIGDSELRVLGGLTATGTPDRPIIFKSGEPAPAVKDWSYVLIFTSGKKNVIRHCQFHNAFSGLQVHFSTAAVSDCLFSDNNEGIRFGRAKLSLRHCRVSNNHIGVRFTRMEGPVEIQRNDISNNRVGIFLVPSGQNIVDFFEPGRTGKPWNEGHLDISANNIAANCDYNLKLGAKQLWNLKIIDNWWGTTRADEAFRSIFDHHRDQELGRAIIEPMAQTPIADAGIRRSSAATNAQQ